MSLYRRGLEVDDLAEEFYRGLIRCCRELGRHTEAIKAYLQCKEILEHTFGVGPSDELEALYYTLKGKTVVGQTKRRSGVGQKS